MKKFCALFKARLKLIFAVLILVVNFDFIYAGPFELLREQLEVDSDAIANFIQQVSLELQQKKSKFTNLGITNSLDGNMYGEKGSLSFLKNSYTFIDKGILKIIISFKNSSESPDISPLLAGKSIELTALNKNADPIFPALLKQQDFNNYPNTANKDTSESTSFDQIKQENERNSKSKSYFRESTPNSINIQKSPEIFSFHCRKLPDKHGKFFAQLKIAQHSVNLAHRLGFPYTGCV